MKKHLSQSLSVIALAGSALLLSFTACSRAPELPPKAVEITGDDKMKYNIEGFEVAAGQKVAVTLKNVGTAPKASMGHNFIALKLNVNGLKFVEAGSMYAGKDYVAPETEKDVIAKTKLLGPGESDTVTFTAPYVKGRYEFVCSFPGHFGGGMKGIMTVQ